MVCSPPLIALLTQVNKDLISILETAVITKPKKVNEYDLISYETEIKFYS